MAIIQLVMGPNPQNTFTSGPHNLVISDNMSYLLSKYQRIEKQDYKLTEPKTAHKNCMQYHIHHTCCMRIQNSLLLHILNVFDVVLRIFHN